MNTFKVILPFFVSIFFLGCDPGSVIKYEVVNRTTKPVIARYQFVFNMKGDSSKQEIIIPAGRSQIINTGNQLGFARQFNESHDSIFIYWLTLEQDKKITNLEFKDKKYWSFQQNDDFNATYKLIVDSTFF